MKPKPFTVQHFDNYCSRIKLDSGEFWELEDFQVEIVEPILAGVTETWAILPQGNGKTSLLAGIALYFCDYTPNPWIPIGASSRDQAEILAQQAYQMIRSSPGMDSRFRIYQGHREIRPTRDGHPGRGSRGIKVYAADVGTADGVIPTLAICDEGHRHPNMSLYRLWQGKLRKRNGQIVMISTAGEPGGEFEEMRNTIRDSLPERELNDAHMRCTGRGIVLNEWQVRREQDITNMEAVKQANPLSSITVETLADQFASPTTDIGDWKRLVCNVPARSHQAAISDAEWEAAYAGANVRIPPGEHVDLGVDVTWKHDTFAIVPLWNGPGYRLLGDAQILVPPRDGSMLPIDDVKVAFEEFFNTFIVDTIVIDLNRSHDIGAWLEDQGVTVIEWSQGDVQAAENYECFMEALRNGTLKHTGHSGLRAHAMHAIARAKTGDKRLFDRPSQSRARKKQDERVIDALAAASFVNCYVATRESSADVLVGSVEDYRIMALG